MTTFDDERRMQPFMDEWYKKFGYTTINRSKSCKQFDVIVSNGDNKINKVEEKFLFSNPYPQGLAELIQDIPTFDKGWLYHVDADYIAWVYCGFGNGRNGNKAKPPVLIHLIKFPLFKEYIFDFINSQTWMNVNICPENYGVTENIPFMWADLQKENISTPYNY